MTRTRSFARRLGEQLLVVGLILGTTLSSSGVALAQTPPTTDQGPRFGSWGPGQAPPEAEGPSGGDTPAPRGPSGRPDAGPGGAARPEMAPAPGYAPGPGPEYAPGPAPHRWGGCNHDLRGSWQINGRQTDPYPYGYSARIHIRQFRNWLQIDQPEDGVSYYGVCRGDQIELDVYAGGRWIGYEDATVAGSGSPWSRWGGLRVRAEWASFAPGYASGRETWTRW